MTFETIKRFFFGGSTKENHEIDEILEEELFEDAKARVQEQLDKSNAYFDEITEIKIKTLKGECLTKREYDILNQMVLLN